MLNLCLLLVGGAFASGAQYGGAQCKCIYQSSCWPSDSSWASFNQSVNGRLIFNTPMAEACYPGSAYNRAQCEYATANYMNASVQLANPIGYQFPLDSPCVASLTLSTNQTCSLGDAPVYTVNVTQTDHLAAALKFAHDTNVRLVVRNTGHDLLGRSTGRGSLQVWMHYYRKGIQFQDAYVPETGCRTSFTGPAFKIHGGYEWQDVYAEAAKRGLLVVGGGTPTVGATGGWVQGGGHSPASHEYGLGADQVLEATVMLADGRIVTADACNEPDLYHAIRGGGPNAYGVVLSTTIKAYPTRNVTSSILTINAKAANDQDSMLDALSEIYADTPSFMDAGFSGFGLWSLYGLGSVLPGGADLPTYTHIISAFEKPLEDAQKVIDNLIDKINHRTGNAVQIDSRFEQYPTYATALAMNPFTNSSQPAGLLVSYGSRLLDRTALTNDTNLLRQTLKSIGGEASEGYTNSILFVGGGQVFRDAELNPPSALNQAWRRTYIHNIIARFWTTTTPAEQVAQIRHNMTNDKVPALKRLAPQMGAYMNEADAFDPDWVQDFYGAENYAQLLRIKNKYDPDHVFYCPTCVGSTEWETDGAGAPCRKPHSY